MYNRNDEYENYMVSSLALERHYGLESGNKINAREASCSGNGKKTLRTAHIDAKD